MQCTPHKTLAAAFKKNSCVQATELKIKADRLIKKEQIQI
jgi:hypothetical protein